MSNLPTVVSHVCLLEYEEGLQPQHTQMIKEKLLLLKLGVDKWRFLMLESMSYCVQLPSRHSLLTELSGQNFYDIFYGSISGFL